MLDSLVRVSRRVGWTTDRFATDHRAHAPASQPDVHSRLAATAQRAVSAGRNERTGTRAEGGPAGPRSPDGPRAGGYNSRPTETSPPAGHLSPVLLTAERKPVVALRPEKVHTSKRARSQRRRAVTANGPHRVAPQLPADELNSPGRLCGSTRFPLSGFTYS